MNRFLSYTLALLSFFALYSCALDEYAPVVAPDNNSGVVSIVASTSTYPDQVASTKAGASIDLSELENKIYNAYLLIYDENGDLLYDRNYPIAEPLTITETDGVFTIQECSVKPNQYYTDMTL